MFKSGLEENILENNFRTIDDTELEDFGIECRAKGFDPEEFNLEEHDYVETPESGIIFSPNAKLTITQKKTNISRTYSTGNATHWVADFSEDLRKGIFK